MKRSCPPPADLMRLVDGEATRNEAGRLQMHLERCAACRAHRDGLMQLGADLARPLPTVAAVSEDERAAAVLRAITTGAAASIPAPRRRGAFWSVGGGVTLFAAAAAILLLGLRDPRPPAGGFNARGGAIRDEGAAGLGRRVGVTLYAPWSRRVAVHQGDRLPTRTLFTAGWRNLERDRDVFLLQVAVDARGTLHWLYPAFTDAGSDPAAVRLPYSPGESVLPDSVTLDSPAAGPLRILTVVSHRRPHVSAIEALPPAELSAALLERRLPDSHVDTLTVELVAAPAKGAVPR